MAALGAFLLESCTWLVAPLNNPHDPANTTTITATMMWTDQSASTASDTTKYRSGVSTNRIVYYATAAGGGLFTFIGAWLLSFLPSDMEATQSINALDAPTVSLRAARNSNLS